MAHFYGLLSIRCVHVCYFNSGNFIKILSGLVMIRNFQFFSDFPKKFQAILKKSYKFQVILWNSWEFFGILRKFHGEYIWVGIPWNSKSALCKLGIQSPNYPENSHLKFLGIPRNFFLRILRKLLVIVGIFKVTSKGLSQTDDCKCQSSRIYYER